MLFDTHAHLDFPQLANDLDSVLKRAECNGVGEIVTIGIGLESSLKAVELAEAHANIYATVGIHPHGAKELDEQSVQALKSMARREKVVAIGEIGLDYYRDRRPRDVQRKCLHHQLEIAADLKLPVVFHARQAYDDLVAIVNEHLADLEGGVLHCFSGDWRIAERFLDLGFYLSIPGTVTFPKAEMQQEVAMRTPIDRLLIETDAPFLAPQPYRGKTNEPAFVLYTAQKIAELRKLPLDEVARKTTSNAHRFFRIEHG